MLPLLIKDDSGKKINSKGQSKELQRTSLKPQKLIKKIHYLPDWISEFPWTSDFFISFDFHPFGWECSSL
jgi:hypothetical protein